MYIYIVVINLLNKLDILFWNSQFAFNKPCGMFSKILNIHLESNIPTKHRITVHLKNKHSPQPTGILDGSLSLEFKRWLIIDCYRAVLQSIQSNWLLIWTMIINLTHYHRYMNWKIIHGFMSFPSTVQHSFHINSFLSSQDYLNMVAHVD